jgi:hypothetical protein
MRLSEFRDRVALGVERLQDQIRIVKKIASWGRERFAETLLPQPSTAEADYPFAYRPALEVLGRCFPEPVRAVWTFLDVPERYKRPRSVRSERFARDMYKLELREARRKAFAGNRQFAQPISKAEWGRAGWHVYSLSTAMETSEEDLALLASIPLGDWLATRRGRKLIGTRAMTNAERQRRHREKKLRIVSERLPITGETTNAVRDSTVPMDPRPNAKADTETT